MHLHPPRPPDRHCTVGTARRPAPSVEDDPHAAPPSPRPTRPNRRWLTLLAVVLFFALFLGQGLLGSSGKTALSYSTFLTDVADKKVASVEVSSTGAPRAAGTVRTRGRP